eukprot:2552827-Amphidinium_carterae.1
MMPAAQAMAAPADSWTDCGFRASLRPSPSAAPPNSFIADGPFATAGTSQDQASPHRILHVAKTKQT